MTTNQKEILKNITLIQKNRFEAVLKSIDMSLPLNLEKQVLQYIEDELEIRFTPYELTFLLINDGFANSELLEFGLEDTAACDSLHSAISRRYLNRAWPTYDDDTDLKVFLNELKSAVKKSRS